MNIKRAARRLKKHGGPPIDVKEPWKYMNRWKSLWGGVNV